MAAGNDGIKDAYRTIALRILPIVYFIFILALLCRFNISFVKEDLWSSIGIDVDGFAFSASLFYAGYVLFQIPSGWLLGRKGARVALLAMMVVWGSATSLQAFIRSEQDLYLLRLLLGCGQAGVFLGLILVLSAWFPDRLRGRYNTMLTSTLPIAGTISGPIAAVVMTNLDGVRGLEGWQWLFLVEGTPVILLGIGVYLWLADGPHAARWLSTEARRALETERASERRRHLSDPAPGLLSVLRNPAIRHLALVYFSFFCGLNAIMFWSPSLLKAAGAEDISSVGWTSGATALLSIPGMLLIGRSSDRFQERRWHVGLSGLISAICLAMLPLAEASLLATAILLSLAGVGFFAVLGLFWTIPLVCLDPHIATPGMAIINMCGVLGGVVSPNLVNALTDTSLAQGVAMAAAVPALGMLSLLVLLPRWNLSIADPARGLPGSD